MVCSYKIIIHASFLVCTVIFCREANNVFFILLDDSFCFVSFFNVDEKFLGYIFCDKN